MAARPSSGRACGVEDQRYAGAELEIRVLAPHVVLALCHMETRFQSEDEMKHVAGNPSLPQCAELLVLDLSVFLRQ